MKYWYYSSQLDNLVNNTELNETNLQLVIDDIGRLFGKEMKLQLIENYPHCKLVRYENESFMVYKLNLYGNDYYYSDTSNICQCNDKFKNKNTFICQHYILFKLFKKLNKYEIKQVPLSEINVLIMQKILNN